MWTILTLDDDLATLLRRTARQTGRHFHAAMKEEIPPQSEL
jgi:hypothetical protein